MDNMNNHSENVKAIYYSSLHSLTNPNANFNNIGVEGADLLSHWVGECMNLGPKVDESKFSESQRKKALEKAIQKDREMREEEACRIDVKRKEQVEAFNVACVEAFQSYDGAKSFQNFEKEFMPIHKKQLRKLIEIQVRENIEEEKKRLHERYKRECLECDDELDENIKYHMKEATKYLE